MKELEWFTALGVFSACKQVSLIKEDCRSLTGCWAFMMQLHKDKDGLTIQIFTTGMKFPPGVTRESLTQTMRDYRDKAQAS